MYEKGEEGRKLLHLISSSEGFPGGPVGKESACNAGDPGSIAGSEDPLEKGFLAIPGFLAFPCGSAGK